MISVTNAIGFNTSLIWSEINEGYEIYKDINSSDWASAASDTVTLLSELWYQDVINIATVQSSSCLSVIVSPYMPSSLVNSSNTSLTGKLSAAESKIAASLGLPNSTYWTGAYPSLQKYNTIWLTLINKDTSCASFDINTFGNLNDAPTAATTISSKAYAPSTPKCSSTTVNTTSNSTNVTATGNKTNATTNQTTTNLTVNLTTTNKTNSTTNSTNSTTNKTNSATNSTANSTTNSTINSTATNTTKNSTNQTNSTTNGTKNSTNLTNSSSSSNSTN
jgi:hypothetical protein